MNRVYLPIGKKAHSPYRINPEGIDIYTLEELCYYIVTQTEMLERSFMSEALVGFIYDQLSLRSLAQKLRKELRSEPTLVGFCALILEKAEFLPQAQLSEVLERIRSVENETPDQKLEKRLNRLAADREYHGLIRQCQLALARLENPESDEVRAGLLMRQAGAYAQLFYFEPAAALYDQARQILHKAQMRILENKASQQYLLCVRILWGEEKYRHFIETHREYLEASMAAEQRYARADSAARLQAAAIPDPAAEFEALRRDFERM